MASATPESRREPIVTLIQIVVLALVQGITEFLPVSSSGHLILVPIVAQWPDQGLAMDVAVHVGALGAVLVYFWRDVWTMAAGLGRQIQGRSDAGARMFWQVVLGTIPVVIAGFALKTMDASDGLRTVAVIGWAMLVGGIILWLADRYCMRVKTLAHLPYGEALIIGLSQVLALIPGMSRSGITMTAARALGYERPEAARFSLLLSIPTILAAGLLLGLEVYESGDAALTEAALIGAGLAFVSALVAITVMMAWLKHASFTPFVLYRIVLGVVLLGVAYGGMA
ncbi:MAG: UDP pyrophosphate phosphatase [Rhodospirillaceae bacterium BRH_c57]|nr:MAG: UDP pyrophosphate phosphatase [Rhodospirillaceae bacterium BRH_c57]